MRTPYLIRIYENVPSYPHGTHESEVYGFGDTSRGKAMVRARAYVRQLQKRTGRTYRIEHQRACDFCGVSGKQPGYKRKKCEVCGGRGVLSVTIKPKRKSHYHGARRRRR